MIPPAFDESADDFVPATQTELARFVADNAQKEAKALYPVGGRTGLTFGNPPTKPGVTVALAKLSRVVDYPARDMTVTVEAGMRLDALRELLQAENQRLPVDIAQSHRATLGGALATNTSGPRRYGCGTLRDYVIGIRGVDAQGRLFQAGGRVVKNVAGYDLCKLLVGSLGTLAIVTQVTLKLRPMPETSAWFVAAFPDFQRMDEALERLTTSQTRPMALEVVNPQGVRQLTAEARLDFETRHPVLGVGFEGSERETKWQLAALKRELEAFSPSATIAVDGKEARVLFRALTEYQTSSDDPLTFKANLLPSRTIEFVERATEMGIAVQAHAGNGIVIGHVSDEASTLAQAAAIVEPLRQFARQHKGDLVIINCDADWKDRLSVFGDPAASWPLMQKLKRELDPQNLLNPGRFINPG